MNLLSFITLAATEPGEKPNPVDHVVNIGYKAVDMLGMKGVWIWSAHVGNLILAGLLTLLVIWWAANKISTGPAAQGTSRYLTTNPLAHMIEVICTYLRETTVRPLLRERTDKFIPFLWTIFFFILFNNLLGLMPIIDLTHLVDHFAAAPGEHLATGLLGATATQNIFVTAALSIVAALVINFAGIREMGIGGYLKHLTAGTPPYLWPLMVPIEILGTFIKPVALALRLFANMTAGHILVAVLFMFAVMGMDLVVHKGGAMGLTLGPVITLASIVAAIAIYFLELFVAFLQAFVFMFLTTVFISQLSHHHDHEHDEAHGHEHAPGHAHAHA